MAAQTIKVKVGRGFEIEARANVFTPKNWLYLNFDKRSKICIDLNTGDIIKGQSHCAPVLAVGEKQRLIEMFKEG